ARTRARRCSMDISVLLSADRLIVCRVSFSRNGREAPRRMASWKLAIRIRAGSRLVPGTIVPCYHLQGNPIIEITGLSGGTLMSWLEASVLLLLYGTALVAGWVAALVWRRRAGAWAGPVVVLLLALIPWSLGQA